jgi:hypothetical protein
MTGVSLIDDFYQNENYMYRLVFVKALRIECFRYKKIATSFDMAISIFEKLIT